MSRWPQRLALACWLVLSLGSLPAEAGERVCPPTARMPDEATLRGWMARAQDRGLLWAFEKQGRRGWLYGTLHVARGEWSVPGPTVAQVIRQADRLALEVDLMDPAQLQRLQQLVAQPAQAPALPPALAARLSAQVEAACLGAALDGQRPEMQVSSLAMLAGRSHGLDPAFGIDLMLSGVFHGRQRPVDALETVDEQARALLSDDPAQAEALIADTLDELESDRGVTQMLRLAEAWARSDLKALSHYEDWCECANTPAQRALLARLMTPRNQRMAERIEALLVRGGQPLVAVGALHLVGPQGLPALLATRGFRLSRLLPREDRLAPATTGGSR